MSAPLPDAFLTPFKQYIEEAFSGREAAPCLQPSPATGSRWARGTSLKGYAVAGPQGRPKRQSKLGPHRVLFAEIIAQDGDITMPKLSAILFDGEGVLAHLYSIGKFLRKLGYSR